MWQLWQNKMYRLKYDKCPSFKLNYSGHMLHIILSIVITMHCNYHDNKLNTFQTGGGSHKLILFNLA